jgi:mRNA interferase MazF
MIMGKVVLVPYPFDDLSVSKVRPAVCLTEPIGPHHHVILAFISSQIPDNLLGSDLVLDSSQADFTTTGLRVSSTLRLHRLITVTTTLIHRELGELSHRMKGEVANRLRKLFGLT